MIRVELSDREIEVLECVFSGWDSGKAHGLYGNVSYQDAISLAEKLGVGKLVKLEEFIAWTEKQMESRERSE